MKTTIGPGLGGMADDCRARATRITRARTGEGRGGIGTASAGGRSRRWCPTCRPVRVQTCHGATLLAGLSRVWNVDGICTWAAQMVIWW